MAPKWLAALTKFGRDHGPVQTEWRSLLRAGRAGQANAAKWESRTGGAWCGADESQWPERRTTRDG